MYVVRQEGGEDEGNEGRSPERLHAEGKECGFVASKLLE